MASPRPVAVQAASCTASTLSALATVSPELQTAYHLLEGAAGITRLTELKDCRRFSPSHLRALIKLRTTLQREAEEAPEVKEVSPELFGLRDRIENMIVLL